VGIRFWRQVKQSKNSTDATFDEVHIHFRLGWLILCVGLIIDIVWRESQAKNTATVFEYLIIWILAMLVLISSIKPDQNSSVNDPAKPPLVHRELLLMLGLFIVSFAIRGVALEDVPYLLDQDEAAFAQNGAAAASLDSFKISPFGVGWQSHPELQSVIIGIATTIFGPTKFAARIVSAIFGSLTIPALYLMGRELFDRRTALIAALFMSSWAYHAHFSRLALNQAGDLFFSTLACYFLLRGLRSRSSINYCLSGIMLAVAQLFYLGARLVPIVFLLFLFYLFFRQRSTITSQWRSFVLLVFSFVVISFPQNFNLLNTRQPITTLFENQSILNNLLPEAIQQGNLVSFAFNQVKAALNALFAYQDTTWYGPGSNLLGWIGGPLFLIGFFTALLTSRKKPRQMLVIIWLAGVVVGGAALQINPYGYERFFPGSTAFALLVAVGASIVINQLLISWDSSRLRHYMIFIIGALIFAGNLAFFVFDFVPARGYFSNEQNWLTNRLADETRLASNDHHYPIVVAGFNTGLLNTPVIQYFMSNRKYSYIDDQTSLDQALTSSDISRQIKENNPITFIVSPKRINDLNHLKTILPGGILYSVTLVQNKALAFYVYVLDKRMP